MRHPFFRRAKTWILVADGSRAQVMRLHENGTTLVPAWQHQLVASNLSSRQLASDKPGRTFDRAGRGRHAKEPPTGPARYEKERFAREVVQKLEHERKRRAFELLIIAEPPQFLGDLRAAMSEPLERCVKTTVNKDLSKLKAAEIGQHLEDVLGRP